jgi:hypothetical protein
MIHIPSNRARAAVKGGLYIPTSALKPNVCREALYDPATVDEARRLSEQIDDYTAAAAMASACGDVDAYCTYNRARQAVREQLAAVYARLAEQESAVNAVVESEAA